MLVFGGVARADSQFPPASFTTCEADFDNPFEYGGPADAPTVAKLATVCETAAKESLAYDNPKVPDIQKKVVAALALLSAAVLCDGNPLNQQGRSYTDAKAADNLFKIAGLEASPSMKEQLDAIIQVIELNLPRLIPKT